MDPHILLNFLKLVGVDWTNCEITCIELTFYLDMEPSLDVVAIFYILNNI